MARQSVARLVKSERALLHFGNQIGVTADKIVIDENLRNGHVVRARLQSVVLRGIALNVNFFVSDAACFKKFFCPIAIRAVVFRVYQNFHILHFELQGKAEQALQQLFYIYISRKN